MKYNINVQLSDLGDGIGVSITVSILMTTPFFNERKTDNSPLMHCSHHDLVTGKRAQSRLRNKPPSCVALTPRASNDSSN